MSQDYVIQWRLVKGFMVDIVEFAESIGSDRYCVRVQDARRKFFRSEFTLMEQEYFSDFNTALAYYFRLVAKWNRIGWLPNFIRRWFI